jgi:Prealbumin-like fold domain
MSKASRRAGLVGALAIAASLLMILPASAAVISLPGSHFEIDSDANLVQDVSPNDDWATITEDRKLDTTSGALDESFGQGAKEDTLVPSVVNGSIPPNKSDLKAFGVYLEKNPDGTKFLNVFWTRVQDPTGTTNMDFEFNKSKVLSANGVTPVRTAGDVLIQYDLANGGTNPQLFLSRWVTSGPGSQCVANNTTPCWGNTTASGDAPRVNLTAAGDATGSINTSPITAANADGLGGLSARTFGEAQIDFAAFAGDETGCVGFGSAYLKSRSSDSFTAALKDFVPPLSLNFNECGAIKVTKTKKHEADPGTTPIPDAGVTFTLSGNGITPVTAVTDANGVACFDGVAIDPDAYTVTETVPAGYVSDDSVKEVVVDNAASCTATPYAGESLSFVNSPLTDVSITINSQIVGGTASSVTCTPDGPNGTTTVGTGDGTFSDTNLVPQTITCTIVIDP